MGVKVYSNTEFSSQIEDGILLEGTQYFLDLTEIPSVERLSWIKKERLSKHLDYIPGNNNARLKFVNVVGSVNLFGTTFDVRSVKLHDGLDGNTQFKSLVDEIGTISNELTFLYSGVGRGTRKVEPGKINLRDVERFDYYYQLAFNLPIGKNLDSLLNQVLKAPNRRTYSFVEDIPVSSSKKVDKSFAKKIGKSDKLSIISGNERYSQTKLGRKLFERTGKNLFPSHVVELKKGETNDTVENRFIKFVLEDIKSICLRLENRNIDDAITLKSIELQSKVDLILGLPFFRGLSRLEYVPDSSSVLLNKAGYRELYYHYVQSKFGFNSLVEELSNESMKAGLKDVATLYEMWCFFKMAQVIFGDEPIKATFGNKGLEHGDLIHEVTWKGNHATLSYNYSYNRGNEESYSLSLRPDISLQLEDGLHLFDAKYKYMQSNNEDGEEIQRYVKSEDLHKMHAYLDAIEGSQSAVALYPGTSLVFYNKGNFERTDNIEQITFRGIGAIPLAPTYGSNELQVYLEKLLDNE